MATISELSLYQASAMSLERTKAELSEKLRDAQERLESGEAPDESADEEFMRIEEQRRRHRELILRRQEEARIQRFVSASASQVSHDGWLVILVVLFFLDIPMLVG